MVINYVSHFSMAQIRTRDLLIIIIYYILFTHTFVHNVIIKKVDLYPTVQKGMAILNTTFYDVVSNGYKNIVHRHKQNCNYMRKNYNNFNIVLMNIIDFNIHWVAKYLLKKLKNLFSVLLTNVSTFSDDIIKTFANVPYVYNYMVLAIKYHINAVIQKNT